MKINFEIKEQELKSVFNFLQQMIRWIAAIFAAGLFTWLGAKPDSFVKLVAKFLR